MVTFFVAIVVVCSVQMFNKDKYDENDTEARERVFFDVAQKVANDFFEYIENREVKANKLVFASGTDRSRLVL